MLLSAVSLSLFQILISFRQIIVGDMNQQYSGMLDDAGKRYLDDAIKFQVMSVLQVGLCDLCNL